MQLPKAIEGKPFNGSRLPVGMAIHTGCAYLGTVVSLSGDMQEISAFGFDVNIAARLADSAKAGEVLISEAALKAAGRVIDEADLCGYELKGVDDPVRATLLKVP